MGKRARHADPHPPNVTIPSPPGHRLRVLRGAQDNRTILGCQCGWQSQLLPKQEAMEAYDAHLDVFGEWCDFCSGLWPIAREYACPNFEIDFGTLATDGTKQIFVYRDEWLACGTCTQLIEEGKWHELAVRAVEGTFLADLVAGRPKAEVLLALYRNSIEYREGLRRIKYLHQVFNRERSHE